MKKITFITLWLLTATLTQAQPWNTYRTMQIHSELDEIMGVKNVDSIKLTQNKVVQIHRNDEVDVYEVPALQVDSITFGRITSCYYPPYSNDIIGRWKLIKLSSYQSGTIDYSEEDIIYYFQPNNKLLITGPVPVELPEFEDFQEGEHSYTYSQPNDCDGFKPYPNMVIDGISDEPDGTVQFGRYRCIAYFEKKTMWISRVESWDLPYLWGKHFIRVK